MLVIPAKLKFLQKSCWRGDGVYYFILYSQSMLAGALATRWFMTYFSRNWDLAKNILYARSKLPPNTHNAVVCYKSKVLRGSSYPDSWINIIAIIRLWSSKLIWDPLFAKSISNPRQSHHDSRLDHQPKHSRAKSRQLRSNWQSAFPSKREKN